MYDQESDEEASILRTRVQTLKHVALEISDELKFQNKELQNLQPGFESTLSKIFMNVGLIRNIKPQYLKTWLWYIGGTLVISFVFFVFFVFT